jgi:hypothetical protein
MGKKSKKMDYIQAEKTLKKYKFPEYLNALFNCSLNPEIQTTYKNETKENINLLRNVLQSFKST